MKWTRTYMDNLKVVYESGNYVITGHTRMDTYMRTGMVKRTNWEIHHRNLWIGRADRKAEAEQYAQAHSDLLS